MKAIKHEQIVERFLQSKAIDFNALGKFVAENGASIVAASSGDYGVNFGHYNILACFNIGPRISAQDRAGLSKIASEVTGAGKVASR